MGVETRLRAGRSGACIPAGAINISPLPNDQTGCGARGYRGAFPAAKSPVRVGTAGAEVMSATVLLLLV